MGMGKLSAWLAIAVGVTVAVAQVVRNWDNLDNWPTWSIDLILAAILLVAGARALQGRPTRALMVAWSLACGMYLAGFVGHVVGLDNLSANLQGPATRLTFIVGGLFAASVVGLALILLDRTATGNEKRPT